MLGTYCLTYGIHRAYTPLQPAPSQNAPEFCLMQMSDTNGCPPTRNYVFWGLRSEYRDNPSAHVFIDGRKEFGKGSWGELVKDCSRSFRGRYH